MAPLTVGLTYELRSAYLARGFSPEETAEFPEDETVDALEAALRQLGYVPDRIGDLYQLVKRLAPVDALRPEQRPWDIVWNICEGVPNQGRGKGKGRGRGGQVPALLDAYGIPYTFADAATLDLVLDKGVTKIFLRHHGIPTSPFVVVPGHYTAKQFAQAHVQQTMSAVFESRDVVPTQARPLFVKPALEGSSKGINEKSKVASWSEMWSAVAALRAQLPDEDIVVEQFADGREFTVSVIGTGDQAKILGANEYIWKEVSNPAQPALGYHSYTSRIEAPEEHCQDIVVDPQTDPEVALACDVALRAYRAVECRDLGRIDIRSIGRGADAQPVVLEINAIAGLQPSHSLPMAARWAGLSYAQLVGRVIESVLESV